jgi:mRNA interferase RelE/StbE
MADFEISFARSARKELESLDNRIVNRIFPKIVALSKQPPPSGCRKLIGEGNLWRVRVGDYRVIYEIDDVRRLVDGIAVKHRSKAYD